MPLLLLCLQNERLPALKRLRSRVVKSSRSVGRYSTRYQRKLEESGAGSGAIVPVSGGVHKPGGVRWVVVLSVLLVFSVLCFYWFCSKGKLEEFGGGSGAGVPVSGGKWWSAQAK